jgi:fumarate reductase flavoprotein subunit
MSENNFNAMSRRNFLKTVGIAGGVVASSGLLAGCAAQPAAGVKWDKTADVVVIGGGGAGLAAAISASKAGAGKSVIVLEKGAATGGSTTLSGGVIQAAGTKYETQFKNVSDDTPEKHYQFYMQAAEGYVNKDLVKLLTDSAPAAIDWMVEQGLAYVNTYAVSPNPEVDEQYRLPRIHVPGGAGTQAKAGTGAQHIAVLDKVVKDLGLEVLLQTPAKNLVLDAAGNVVGVNADANGKTLMVKANKGVVIATSSFDHNEEMCRAFSLQQLWELQTGVCYTAPTNTGDGIKMGMAVGADLEGMGGTVGVEAVTMGADPLAEGVTAVPGIWVNVQGQRFVNEATHYAYSIRAVFNQQGHKAFAIFDDKVRQMGGAVLGGIWGPWSDDLAAEIAAGKVFKADTLEALAQAIGINANQLPVTVAQWNEQAKAGEDKVFGKKVALQAFETAPFYAAPVTSVNLGSCGGLKINTSCQVLNVEGKVIPHLYAAGMAAGGYIGPYYPGSGTAVLATVVLGRVAGEAAAKETAVA